MKRHPQWALAVTLGLCALYTAAAALSVRYFASEQHPRPGNRLPAVVPTPAMTPAYLLRDIWLRFDTVWYLDIAREGYADPHGVVFYPLFPALIRLLSSLGLHPLSAALLISRLAVFFLLWGLLPLFELDLPPPQARLAIALLLLWPSGFMLFAAYPDSLLLALVVWALHFARAGNWYPAALCAAFACASKAVGAAVLVALVVLCWQQKKWPLAALAVAFAGALIYPAGLFLAGLPQPARVYSEYWRTVPALPWDTLWSAAAEAVRSGDLVLQMNLFCIVFVTFCALFWRFQPSSTAFALAAVVLFLTKKTDPLLQSTIRYLVVVFPAFAGMARGFNSPLTLVPLVFVFLLLHAVLLFAFWQWSLVV